MLDAYDKYRLVRFADVKKTRDIIFANVMSTRYDKNTKGYIEPFSEDLKLDLYEPIGDESIERPVIVWIHGGGFRVDSYKIQKYIVEYATEFAKRGFVCLSIEYRLRYATGDKHETEFPALQDAARDANTVLDWIKSNAEEFRLDATSIFIAGGSAGGRTAITTSQFIGPDSEVLYEPENKYREFLWDKKGIVACAVLWGGLEPDMREWVYPYLNKNSVPTILVHGDADKTIDVQNTIDLFNALQSAGVSSEMHIMTGKNHTPVGCGTNPQIWSWIVEFFIKQWKDKF